MLWSVSGLNIMWQLTASHSNFFLFVVFRRGIFGLGVKLVELEIASLDTHSPPQSREEGSNIDFLLETLRLSEDDSVQNVLELDSFTCLLGGEDVIHFVEALLLDHGVN